MDATASTLTTSRQYEVPVANLKRLEAKISRLSRRAVKLGCAPVIMERVADAQQMIKPIGRAPFIVEIAVVVVTGPAPQIPGWTFAGTLQHLEAEGERVNILRALVDNVPTRYRDAAPACNHCQAARQRRDTYLLLSDAGDWKQVGRNCLVDFTGHPAAEDLATAAEWLVEVSDACNSDDEESWAGGAGGAYSWPLRNFLGHCLDFMAVDGFVSRKVADIRMCLSTAGCAMHALIPPKGERYVGPSALALDKADTIIAWLTDWTDDSDFAWNCRTIGKVGRVDHRTAGIAAAICIAYERALGRLAEATRAAGESQHFGTVGKREPYTLTAVRRHSYDTDYGTKTIVVYRDDNGNLAVWFASGVPEVEIGHRYTVKATVKEHGYDERDGARVAQTVLQRVAVVTDHGNPRAIPLQA